MYPYILQGDNLTVLVKNKTYQLNKNSHPNFQAAVDAIRSGEWDKIPDLVDLESVVRNFLSQVGDVTVRNGGVYYRGEPMAGVLVERVMKMIERGFDVLPLLNFINNLQANPAKHAVDELYLFLEIGRLPITSDGCFLAYKKVRGDYYDIHSGKVSNKPAFLFTEEDYRTRLGTFNGVNVSIQNDTTVLEMQRNRVDDKRSNLCSSGLHFCSLKYLPNFGSGRDDRILIVKINPRDVVSIPSDYDNTKGRTCRYEVVAEHNVDDAGRPEDAFGDAPIDDRFATRIDEETLRNLRS